MWWCDDVGQVLGGEVQIFLFPSHLPVKLSCMKKGAEALRHHFHRFSLIFILQTVVRVSCVHHWNLRCAEDSILIMSTPQILCQGSSWTPWNSCFSAGPYYNLCRRGPTRSSQSIRMLGKWWENNGKGPSCVPKLFGKKGNTRKNIANWERTRWIFKEWKRFLSRPLTDPGRVFVDVKLRNAGAMWRTRERSLMTGPNQKGVPPRFHNFCSDVLKMVIQIISNHDNCYTMLYISWSETDLHIPLVSSDLNVCESVVELPHLVVMKLVVEGRLFEPSVLKSNWMLRK